MDAGSLSHTKWEGKYHVVFIAKNRRKALYGELRRDLTVVFRELAYQRESEIEEGHLMPDHMHMMNSIPPKYSVSQVVGYVKGKSAIFTNSLIWCGPKDSSDVAGADPLGTVWRRETESL